MKHINEQISNIGDIDVSYCEYCCGYPIVMVMGYSGEKEFWSEKLIMTLSKSFRVIIFDNRGIGGSSTSEREFTIELFAEDTKNLLGALGIERAHILGWSMGTYITQEVVMKYPDKVTKLIMLSGNCRGKESVKTSQEVLNKLTDTSGTLQEIGERCIKLLFPAEYLEEQGDMSWIYSNIKRKPHIKNIQKQGIALRKWKGNCSRLKKINKSALIITGSKDIVIPPENSFVMSKKIKSAWLIQFENAGHGLMFQYQLRLSDIIKVFLKD